jgi:hypothetical protein
MSLDDQGYPRICAELDALSDQPTAPRFRELLTQLQTYAERDSIEAAEYAAELLADDGPNHDAAAAYRWYFVALAAQVSIPLQIDR